MAPVEVDIFNGKTREPIDGIDPFDVQPNQPEIIEFLPPAKLEISCDDEKRKDTLNVTGEINFTNGVLYDGSDDEKGSELNLSEPIDFIEGQSVEIESTFHDEMIALTYVKPPKSPISQPSIKNPVLV